VKILVGTDVQPIDEVAASMTQFGERYTRRLFTDHEIECCGENPVTAAPGLAARFAAKEAVLKILDSTSRVPPWKSIEVQRESRGAPKIVLRFEAADLAHEQGIENISLSLSHGGGIASAVVVAQVAELDSESPS
jgi:holo-[acyl-carrier protein] synthase